MRRGLLVPLALVALGAVSACGRSDGTPASAAPGAGAEPPAAAAPPDSDGPSLTPEGLPDDVPIPDGLRAVLVTSDEPGATTALFTGDLDPDEVARSFEDGLRKSGWTIDETKGGAEHGLLARKRQRIASVVVTRLSGKLHVELGLWAPAP